MNKEESKMKKRWNLPFFMLIFILSICMIRPLNVKAESMEVAKIQSNMYESLYDAINAAQENDIIEVLKDSMETKSIEIKAGITIKGNGHTITFELSDRANSFISIKTSNKVVVDNIKIEGNARGFAIDNPKHNFTLNNSTLTIMDRGVSISSDSNENSALNINNCIIQQKGITNYNEEVPNNGNSRGISLWQYQNSNISIKDTTIQGFTYVINTASQVSFSGTKLTIDKCILKGRAGLNVWDKDFNIEVTNSEILGINNQSGPTESFADIVLNTATQNINLQITNTKFSNYQNETGKNNPGAQQYMLTVRSENNSISISGNTTFTDSTNKIDRLFEQVVENNKIEILGGQYDYDVKDYLAEGYISNFIDGSYRVSKVVNDPIIDIPTIDLNNKLTEAVLGVVDTSQMETILKETLSQTAEIDIRNKNVKITMDMNNTIASEDTKNGVQNLLNEKTTNANIIQYFDIAIHVIDVDTNNVIGDLSKLNNKINFTVLLPTNLEKVKDGYQRKFYIVKEHDHNYELIEPQISDDGTYLTFATDEFSTYALTYSDEKVIENPKTHENIILYIAMEIIFLGSLNSIIL